MESTVSSCVTKNIDTTISGVMLCDYKSSVSVLGNEWKPVHPDHDWSYQVFHSFDGKQELRTFIHDGGAKFQYDEFEVSYNAMPDTTRQLPITNFISGNGICLGFSKDSVLSLLGSCCTIKQTDHGMRLVYTAGGAESKTIQRFRQAAYFGHYDFANDTLVKFRFGFIYP